MNKTLIFLCLVLSVSAIAQVQNPLRKFGTNIYDFNPIFRSFQQKEIASSPFLVAGEVFQVNDNGVHIVRKEPKPQLSPEFSKELTRSDTSHLLKMLFAQKQVEKWRAGQLSAGEMMAIDADTRQIVLDEIEREKNYFDYVRVLVTNCPNASILQGKQVQFFAMPVGTYTFKNSGNDISTIPRYDYGQPYSGDISNLTVFSVTKTGIIKKETAQELAAKKEAAAKKLLSWQFLQSSNGVAYVQYDLAKRYLNGDGVTKDETIARYWLKSSADQNYEPAIKLLETIGR